MSLLRCFSIKVRKKRKPESAIALLVQGDEDDGDDDEDYASQIRRKRLFRDDKDLEVSVGDDEDHDHDYIDIDNHDHDYIEIDHHDHVDIEYDGLRRFNWDEIERLKGYRSIPSSVAYGGFTMISAVKLGNSSGVALKFYKGKGLQVYMHELEILLLLQHDNIVKLLGYCDDQEKGVLVLENIANVTLRDKLCSMSETPSIAVGSQSDGLSWKSRMKITYQLIQAIEYLHEKCPQQIVHGDIKPSNILLDEQLNSKLRNFRSAKMGPQDGLSPFKGQFVLDFPGYTDYHYFSTGIALKQHDIYSFGIIVLEVITGIEAPWLHMRGSVVSHVDYMLSNKATLVKNIDPRLGNNFDTEEARSMASISAKCLHSSLSSRPSASDIVQEMRKSIRSIDLNYKTEFDK